MGITFANILLAYVTAIKQVQPEGPYHLLGFSMGGVVAQAMTSILESENSSVALLVAIDSRIRGINTNNEVEDKIITNLLINHLQKAIQTSSPSPSSSLILKDDITQEEQWKLVDTLLTQLFHQSPTPSTSTSTSSSPFAVRFSSLFRKHLRLLASHSALPTSCTTLVLACKDTKGEREGIEREWREKCESAEFMTLPASFTHNAVMYEPCIKYLASIILARLSCL